MSPSQHMGLPILCIPPRVSVDPGNTILMSWNSASNQLTILYFMIKNYRWNSRVCLIFHSSTCSSRRSSQSFWFATTWTSLFGPLRPIPHCPQKSPFPFIPVLLPSECQFSLRLFSLLPKSPQDWAKYCCIYTSSTGSFVHKVIDLFANFCYHLHIIYYLWYKITFWGIFISSKQKQVQLTFY